MFMQHDAVFDNLCYFRALFIMSKSGFKPPQLKDKNKWYVGVKVVINKNNNIYLFSVT